MSSSSIRLGYCGVSAATHGGGGGLPGGVGVCVFVCVCVALTCANLCA